MTGILYDEWKALAKRVDILAAAQKHGMTLKKQGSAEWAGPCRTCGGKDRFAVNTRKQQFNCRGFGGGDVIAMVMHLEGVDFKAACELLTGAPPPRGDSTLDREEIKRRRERLEREEAERQARRAREQAIADEKKRRNAYDLYRCAVSATSSVVWRYLEHARGIDPRSPAVSRIKVIHDLPYWHEVDGKPRKLYTGPVMAIAIQGRDDRFIGVHLTWLMPDGSDKVTLFDPVDGERLPAKKFRGLARGGAIRLTGNITADILLAGEGIETTLSVYDSLRRQRPDIECAAWAAASLGNLGGGGVDFEPDMDDPGFLPPAWAKKVILLGDGDSDPETTGLYLERGRRRMIRLGFAAAKAMAERGKDFNDMLRGL